MLQANVEVNGVYWTYIGESLAQVVVLAKVTSKTYGTLTKRKQTRFRVARVGNPNNPLPKTRTASALRV